MGNAVVSEILTESGVSLNQDYIMELLLNRIARFKHQKQIIFVEKLTRNSMGKVQKNVLKESYE